jgi:hypothetical protein
MSVGIRVRERDKEMASVKVRKTGISAEQAADVLRRGLGESYRVEPEGAGVRVRKGVGRAKVNFHEEAGGTVFEVRGQGFTPLMILISNLGIAKRTAAAIDAAAEFHDDY